METIMQAWRIPAVAATVAAFGFLCGPAAAQLDEARDQVQETTEAGAQAQSQIDAVDDDREELERNYRSVIRRLEDLRAYNDQRRALIASQMAEMDSIREQIDRVKTIERDIVPLMSRMIEAVELFVQLDVPFLIEERSDRVERLRGLLTRSDVTLAEKFRLVLEAYQIENDYGRTIEAYSGEIGEGDGRRQVDFLMIGRVGFYYQTKDRLQTAIWNQQNREWEMLPQRYAGPVRTAMDMAQEFIPPEILVLPLYGPEEATGDDISPQTVDIQNYQPPAPIEDDTADSDGEDAAEDDGSADGDDAGGEDDAADDQQNSN